MSSSSASASKYLVVPGYSLVNARVGFRWTDGWSLYLWSRNVFDEEYEEVSGFGVAGTSGYAGAAVRF